MVIADIIGRIRCERFSPDKSTKGKHGPAVLARRHDLDRAAPIKNIDDDSQPRAAQGDIDRRSVNGKIEQPNLANEVRQHGPLESDVKSVEIEAEPETGLEHEERGRRRPRLKHAGDRI